MQKSRIEILGHKHPSTLATQRSIARCFQENGSYEEAIVKYTKVQNSQIEILGHKHPSTIETQNNIANCT